NGLVRCFYRLVDVGSLDDFAGIDVSQLHLAIMDLQDTSTINAHQLGFFFIQLPDWRSVDSVFAGDIVGFHLLWLSDKARINAIINICNAALGVEGHQPIDPQDDANDYSECSDDPDDSGRSFL